MLKSSCARAAGLPLILVTCSALLRAGDDAAALPGRALFRLGDQRLRHRAHLGPVAFSPDGTILAAGGVNVECGVRLWNATTGEQIDYLAPPGNDSSFVADWRDRDLQERNQRPWIGHAVFSADGRQLVTSTNEHIYVWDVGTGLLDNSIAVPAAKHGFRIGLAPDGRTLAAVQTLWTGEPGVDTIRLFDLKTRRQLLTLEPRDARALSFAFSADGSRLVSGFDGGTAIVWDVARR